MALIMLDKSDGVATITLNRPEAMNALSHELRSQLFDACQTIAADKNIRAVIVTGAGKRAFTAGLDLKELGEQGLGAATDQNPARNPCRALESLEIPVIGAINGVPITGGFELALACDIRIASTTARWPQIWRVLIPNFSRPTKNLSSMALTAISKMPWRWKSARLTHGMTMCQRMMSSSGGWPSSNAVAA